MSAASVQWAYGALNHLGGVTHLGAAASSSSRGVVLGAHRSPTVVLGAAPNVLVSTAGDDGVADPRVVLLARRGSGAIAGVELLPHRHPLRDAFTGAAGRQGPPTRKAQLAVYLASRGVEAVGVDSDDGHPSGLGSFVAAGPLLLHANHLVAWKLARPGARTAASPLYAHSLAELARLSAREARTLDPHRCLLGCRWFEWDSWRQLVREPGWALAYADDAVLGAALGGEIAPAEVPLHAIKIELEDQCQ